MWGSLRQPRRVPGSLLGSRPHLGEADSPLKSCDGPGGCRGVVQGSVLTFSPHPADLPAGETHPRTPSRPSTDRPRPFPLQH